MNDDIGQRREDEHRTAGPWSGAGKRIHMQEVGTRDGLQVEAQFVPTEDKIALVNALSASGLAKIEVTSFVSPKAIPQLKDAEIVLREIERKPGVDLQRAGAQPARRRARHRRPRRRAQPRHVGHRVAQPRQPAHDARAVVRRAGRGGEARAGARRARQHLAVLRLRLPDGGRRGRGHGARLVRALCRGDRRLGRVAVRHHRHGLSDAGRTADAGLPRALARHRADAALPQHPRHGAGQRAGGHRRRRRPLRRLARRHRRLSVRAGGHRQRLQRGDRACARADGLRHRHRPADV